jgi:flagellin
MGMVVRTNMAAMNANNSLAKASKAQQSGMQKLASGYKINAAKDDASGLAITEKMKNQIKALDTAKDNCEDGANMIQTAEGYMKETHDILTRMTELAEKAANGLLEKEDRGALQNEMDQLCAEIDRMASTANFNGVKLMDGTLGKTGEVKITSTANTATTGGASKAGSIGYTDPTGTNNGGITLQIGESSTNADRLTVNINSFHTDALLKGISGFQNQSINGTDVNTATNMAKAATMKNSVATYTTALTVDISTDANKASAAADAIRQVANYVSDQRGVLGAQQNRLDHTVNNLATASENTTASKSRILDTDMAKEMMEYTSKNVIAQAAQSMLAQANSQPQNVLSLRQ